MVVLENILSQEIVQRLGWTLLHFIWQAAAVALLLAILLRVLRKSTANLRYIFACLDLALIVLSPVITIQLVPVSVSYSPAHIEPVPVPHVLPAEATKEISIAETPVLEKPFQPENIPAAPAVSWKEYTAELLEPTLPYIVLGWLVGVLGLSVWHLGGWAQLQRLRRKMVKPVDSTMKSKLRELTDLLGVNRVVQLLESALVQVPTVIGWLRPVILLPASALTGLTTEQLEAMLAHELAHIKRFDYLVNMLQTVVEILGFYHPAVWWVSHKIRAERENCCDDLAVSISGDRVRYAKTLTLMEEMRAGQAELAVAASGGNLLVRIRRLVGKEPTEKTSTSWVPAVIGILLIIALVMPTGIALTAHNKTGHSAKFLLDKMLEHRSKVKNLQYVTEYNTWRAGHSEEGIEQTRKSIRERGVSERMVQKLTARLSREPQASYSILKCTIDNQGCAKIERTTGTYDSSGNKMPRGDKNISAWNGVLGTDFNQIRGAPGGATIKDTPPIGASRQGHPWKTFTGAFCRELAEAIKAERQISIDEVKDGTYRIVIHSDSLIRIAVIEPSQGYSCTTQESHKEGQLTYLSTSRYKEVAKGIWFPVSGQTKSYAPDGSLRSKYTIETRQIKINDPAFNESYFDVDLPKGATVRDYVQGQHYVVGSKSVYKLVEPGTLAEEEVPDEVDPNSWQEKFYSIYSLEDGEVLKRIAPPFIPERRGYFLFIQPGRYSPNTPHHVARLYFNWDGKLSIRGSSVGGAIPRLNSILESVIGLGNSEYDIPPEILGADMSGDWIVRKDTPQEELLQALKQIVKDETAREIEFVKKKVETEVIIARGKYDFKPLPNVKEENYVLICTDKMHAYIEGPGGGSGTVSKFLRWVGNRVQMPVIDETESEDIKIYWRNHDSSDLRRLRHNDELYNEKLKMLLNNLSRQTGLTFERTTAPVEKWFIAEQESSTESIPIPVPAKSPAPSAQDKTIILVDCLVVEVFTDLKMDWETTIQAENLLGNKISLRDTKVDVLLRKAAGATAATKDKSAENKWVTQDQFKALTDMLTSKGYLKILMHPTLEVINGKTAKISSSQHVPLQKITKTIPGAAGLITIVSTETEYIDVVDSLEITPHVFADGHISLQVEATINSKSIPKGEVQIPIVTTHEISTLAHISPGEILLIGGVKKTEKSTEANSNVKDTKEQATEVLFILTPTIIAPATDSQEKTDVQVEVGSNGWGEVVEGLRVRWVHPNEPIVRGTAPVLTMEVENVSSKQIIWECSSGFTWGLNVHGVSPANTLTMPKFRVQVGSGASPEYPGGKTGPEPQPTDHYKLEPEGRIRLSCALPWVLPDSGQYTVNGVVWRRKSKTESLEIGCSSLVLNVVNPTSASNKLAYWGAADTLTGLQLGLSFDLQARPYRQGEVISFKVYVHNVGDKKIKLVHFGLLGWGPTIFDSNGTSVFVLTPRINMPVQKQNLSLNPGETQLIGSVFLKVESGPDIKWDGKSSDPRCYLKPGTYRISQKYRFIDDPQADWHGELTTGELELTILHR